MFTAVSQWDGSYGLYEYGIIFFICTSIGWVWESIYESILAGRVLNRGFLYGPCIPIYGVSACIMIMTGRPLVPNWIAIAVVGIVVATLFEEVTGRLMEKIFGVKYWSYEGYPGNVDDFICIPVSFFWGICAIIANKYLIIPFNWIFENTNPEIMRKILVFLVAVLAVDITMSVKNALDFKEMVERIASSKNVLSGLARRLDLLLERYDSNHEYRKRLTSVKIEDLFFAPKLLGTVRERMDLMYELMRERRKNRTETDELSETDEFELQEIRDQYMQEEQIQDSYGRRFGRYMKHLMFTSPRARIIRFGKSLKDFSITEITKLSDWKKISEKKNKEVDS